MAANGDITRYQYDKKQRLTGCTLPDARTIRCEYDREDNLLLYNENGSRITRFGYFGQGRLQSRTDPDGSLTEYLYDTEDS